MLKFFCLKKSGEKGGVMLKGSVTTKLVPWADGPEQLYLRSPYCSSLVNVRLS